jgi:hypothetical protein
VKRLKHAAKLESGHTPSRSVTEHWQEDNDIPWVSLNDTKYLANHDYISDTVYHVNELGLANSSAHLLPERVVVFTRDATIGEAAITTRPMAVSQHIIAWVCRPGLVPEYLLRVFDVMQEELERLTMGATLRTIGMPEVRQLVTPVPPKSEQRAIVAYLLLLLQSYHLGFEVGRYISIERLIEQNKERYYETLEQSSQGWHEGKADPWPYVGFVLYILRSAYREFAQRVDVVKEPRGAKAELVEEAIASMQQDFSVLDLERICPGVSRDHIRRVLKMLRSQGQIESLGRGPGALWRRKEGYNSKRLSGNQPAMSCLYQAAFLR